MSPDATITKLRQMDYAQNLGHGETKVCGADDHVLAIDLLRLSILSKNPLHHNKL